MNPEKIARLLWEICFDGRLSTDKEHQLEQLKAIDQAGDILDRMSFKMLTLEHILPHTRIHLKQYFYAGSLHWGPGRVLQAIHFPKSWEYTIEMDNGDIFDYVPAQYLEVKKPE